MITRKFFPADKNYLLKEAQNSLTMELQVKMFEIIRDIYMQQFNPLGLQDDFIRSLNDIPLSRNDFFTRPYQLLCAIYRYQYGDNQLEFMWDGKSHIEKYQEEWDNAYSRWLKEMCYVNPSFTRAITKHVYAANADLNAIFIEKYLREQILKHFGFKLYRKRGLVPMTA